MWRIRAGAITQAVIYEDKLCELRLAKGVGRAQLSLWLGRGPARHRTAARCDASRTTKRGLHGQIATLGQLNDREAEVNCGNDTFSGDIVRDGVVE